MATEVGTSAPSSIAHPGVEPEEDEEHWLYGDENSEKQPGDPAPGFPDSTQESHVSSSEDKDTTDQVAQSGEDEDEEDSDSDSDEDDVKVTIGNIKTGAPSYMATPMNLSLKTGRGYGAAATAKLQPKGIDLEATGNINGLPVLEADPDSFEDKPWRKPGADLSDYFNYGFNEDTWKAYCEKQRRLQLGLDPAGPAATENKITVQQGRMPVLEKDVDLAAIKPEFKADFPPTPVSLPPGRVKAGPPPNRKLGGTIDVIGGQTGAIRRVEGRRREKHASDENPIQVPAPGERGPPETVMPTGAEPGREGRRWTAFFPTLSWGTMATRARRLLPRQDPPHPPSGPPHRISSTPLHPSPACRRLSTPQVSLHQPFQACSPRRWLPHQPCSCPPWTGARPPPTAADPLLPLATAPGTPASSATLRSRPRSRRGSPRWRRAAVARAARDTGSTRALGETGSGSGTETGPPPPASTATRTSATATTAASGAASTSGSTTMAGSAAASGRSGTASAGTATRRTGASTSPHAGNSTTARRERATEDTSTRRTSAARRTRRPPRTGRGKGRSQTARSSDFLPRPRPRAFTPSIPTIPCTSPFWQASAALRHVVSPSLVGPVRRQMPS